MVDHCLSIEDREQRTQCAYTIIESMANLFPDLKNGGEYDHKLWDHLAIMSDFQLDIDYPCEVIKPDNLHTKPERVEYQLDGVRRRHYGKTIEAMIMSAADMEAGDEKDELIKLIAAQMKKTLLAVNSDGVEDSRVFRDLMEISGGRIRVDESQMKIREFIIPAQPTGKKKKKK
jgi:hypothetical protein